jgi:replication-associated recombination protein RarA
MSNQYKNITKRGYMLDEVTSALIKSLRRGLEEEALFWGQEIEESGYYRYIWKRLRIFATEDIGLIDPDAIVRINALAQAYETIKKNQNKKIPVEGDLLAMAILYLARAPKNREVDEFKNHIERRKREGWMPEIPCYALDVHTRRGRKAGKTEADWWKEGAQIEGKEGTSKYSSENERG